MTRGRSCDYSVYGSDPPLNVSVLLSDQQIHSLAMDNLSVIGGELIHRLSQGEYRDSGNPNLPLECIDRYATFHLMPTFFRANGVEVSGRETSSESTVEPPPPLAVRYILLLLFACLCSLYVLRCFQ